MMEIIQEPTFTAFLVLALFYLISKIFTSAVASSNSYRQSADYPLYEGGAVRITALDKGLTVRKADHPGKVLFIGDDVINRVDFHIGSESSGLFKDDCNTSTDNFFHESSERVCEFGENERNTSSGEFCSGVCEAVDRWRSTSAAEIVEESDECVHELGDAKFNEVLAEQEIPAAGCNETVGGVAADVDGAANIDHDERKRADYQNVGDVRICEVVAEAEGSDPTTFNENDDWEGIERSELEKVFAAAVNYVELGFKGRVGADEKMEKLGGDVQMELYGLHKVAVEGPCHEPQPMAFKLSARAKWNAWNKLGRLSREKAMEKYVRVLSERIPRWSDDYHVDDDTPYSEPQVHEDRRKSEAIDDLCVNSSIAAQNSAGKDDPI